MADRRYESISKEEFRIEFEGLRDLIHKFERDILKKLGLSLDSVNINTTAIRDIIERVHKRRHYYKIFHDSEEILEHKETALYIYWILKLRPLLTEQQISTKEDSYDFNESFCIYLFDLMVFKLDSSYRRDSYWAECQREIIYSFRYRDLTKDSIILLFEPFVSVKRRQTEKDKL